MFSETLDILNKTVNDYKHKNKSYRQCYDYYD